MPSHYAHYRFGVSAIGLLPPEVRRTVQRFRQLYDVGLHGPDIFFYHNILFRDNVVALGTKLHGTSGEDFFIPVCRSQRLEPNEAAMAYLYGVLAHYCLDSSVHPLVYRHTEDGKIGHAELETEFDRFLLQLDGKRQPNTFDCSPHMRLTNGECATVADFYGDVTATAVSTSIRGMSACVRLLAMPNGTGRRILEKSAGARLRQHFMGRSPNKNCAHLNGALLEAYDEALGKFPAMAAALQAHMRCNAPLGELFAATFNG